MPFTPFHLGPSLLLGMLLLSCINLPALLIGSVSPDIEGLYNILADPPGMDHHEFLHSYLGALVASLLATPLVYFAQDLIGAFTRLFGVYQRSSLKVIIISLVLGAWSHVLLDSFLYIDQDPFLPLEGNPFYPPLGEPRFIIIYLGCSLSFLCGLMLLVWRPNRGNPAGGN